MNLKKKNWFHNSLTMNAPDEDYSRNESCSLNMVNLRF